MKKIVALLLGVTMLANMGSIIYADNSKRLVGLSDSEVIPVYGTYDATGSQKNVVYCVRLSWDSLDFHYTVVDNRVWQPTTHSYTGELEYDWGDRVTSMTRTVEVVNRSNAPVEVSAVLENQKKVEGLSFTLGNKTSMSLPDASLVSGVGPSPGYFTIHVQQTGQVPDSSIGEDPVTVATLKITVTAAEP